MNLQTSNRRTLFLRHPREGGDPAPYREPVTKKLGPCLRRGDSP